MKNNYLAVQGTIIDILVCSIADIKGYFLQIAIFVFLCFSFSVFFLYFNYFMNFCTYFITFTYICIYVHYCYRNCDFHKQFLLYSYYIVHFAVRYFCVLLYNHQLYVPLHVFITFSLCILLNCISCIIMFTYPVTGPYARWIFYSNK